MGASEWGFGEDGRRGLKQAVEAAYGVSVTALVPVRSAYKVVSPRGVFCLREMDQKALPKVAFLRDVTEYLWERGFDRVPRFIPTRAGEPTWVLGQRRYSLTDWLPGKECWLENRGNLEAAAAALAALHRASEGFALRPEHAPAVRLGTWAEEFAAGERFLAGSRLRASFPRRPSPLDRWLLDNCEWLSGRLAEARARLLAVAVPPGDWGPGVFCHSSLYYQNILIDRGGTVYFVDLDKAVWDHRTRDLAHFLDRYLHRVGWRTGAAFAALGAYERVWPLSPLDRELLYLRLVYPLRLLKRLRAAYATEGLKAPHSLGRVESLARHGKSRAALFAALRRWAGIGCLDK